MLPAWEQEWKMVCPLEQPTPVESKARQNTSARCYWLASFTNYTAAWGVSLCTRYSSEWFLFQQRTRWAPLRALWRSSSCLRIGRRFNEKCPASPGSSSEEPGCIYCWNQRTDALSRNLERLWRGSRRCWQHSWDTPEAHKVTGMRKAPLHRSTVWFLANTLSTQSSWQSGERSEDLTQMALLCTKSCKEDVTVIWASWRHISH